MSLAFPLASLSLDRVRASLFRRAVVRILLAPIVDLLKLLADFITTIRPLIRFDLEKLLFGESKHVEKEGAAPLVFA